MSDLYQEIILEEIKNLQHQGKLYGGDVVTHHERNASCGDEVQVFVRSNQDGIITELTWQGQGCAISMASMSLLAEKIKQEQLATEEVVELSKATMLDLLGLDEISPGRIKCMLLGLKAVKVAINK